jgi:hypothetical protein
MRHVRQSHWEERYILLKGTSSKGYRPNLELNCKNVSRQTRSLARF